MDLNFLSKLFSSGASMPQAAMPAAPMQAPPVPVNPMAPPQAPEGANLLQNLNMGAPANVVQPPAGPLVEAPAPAAAPAPRERRSILDTVGRLADVFAKVGGADALYQPTLDAREDRSLALGDHARKVDLDKLAITTAGQQVEENAGDLGDKGNARLGNAVRGVRAILAANPQANVAQIWPLIAKQAGIPDERAAAVGQAIVENPGILDGLAGAVGATKEFGLQPFYAKGKDGTLQAYQIGKDGSIQPIALPDGATPSDPVKFVDTGGAQVGVGSRSGRASIILPKSEKPGDAADRSSREGIARGNNRTAITIAGMPARSKPAAAGDSAESTASKKAQAVSALEELKGIYGKLNKAGAQVNPNNSAVGNVLARVRSSGVGQMAEGAVGTEAQTLRDRINSIRPSLMQTLAKATGMSGKQLDSNADVKLFMQTVTDPSKSYQANMAAIAGLERMLAGSSPAAKPAPRGNSSPRVTPRAAPARKPAAGKPSVTNW